MSGRNPAEEVAFKKAIKMAEKIIPPEFGAKIFVQSESLCGEGRFGSVIRKQVTVVMTVVTPKDSVYFPVKNGEIMVDDTLGITFEYAETLNKFLAKKRENWFIINFDDSICIVSEMFSVTVEESLKRANR